MERYCSSYLDRHGLYNDGFPCPGQTHCCEKSDGTKMCCPDMSENRVEHIVKQAPTSTLISQMITTKSKFYQDLESLTFNNVNSIKNRHQNQIENNKQYLSANGFARTPSNVSLLMSNPTLLLGVCLAFSLLVIITSLLLVCLFRYCMRSKKNHQDQTEEKKATKTHHHHNDNTYSRNSSSSGSSNATSSTSNSPKATDITMEDEEDINECQKILTIDPNSHHQGHVRQMLGSHQTNNTNLMLSNRSSNVNDYLLQTRLSANNGTNNNNNNNIHSIYCNPASHYMSNVMSSGSSSVCTSLLLNNLNNINSANTTQSFVFNSQLTQENNVNGVSLNLINDFDKANTDGDTEDENDPGDFISSTTSNLEFLKTHSLFNSTPMNYYPTLGLTNSGISKAPILETKETATAFPQPPGYSEPKPDPTSSTPNVGDFRFSTFLPSNIYCKNQSTELI